MQTIRVKSYSHTSWGSGSTHTSFKIDGKIVSKLPYKKEAGEKNPFIFSQYSLVPVLDLRGAKHVEYCDGSSPGGESSFKGSGKHFIKWILELNDRGGDPLNVPIGLNGCPRLPKTKAFYFKS